MRGRLQTLNLINKLLGREKKENRLSFFSSFFYLKDFFLFEDFFFHPVICTHCTGDGAEQERRYSTHTCPTLCPIIPIKATHFLGWLDSVWYWERDSYWSSLIQSQVLSYFQVQTTSLFPLAPTSDRPQSWLGPPSPPSSTDTLKR